MYLHILLCAFICVPQIVYGYFYNSRLKFNFIQNTVAQIQNKHGSLIPLQKVYRWIQCCIVQGRLC